jgi:hypothetical protein
LYANTVNIRAIGGTKVAPPRKTGPHISMTSFRDSSQLPQQNLRVDCILQTC